jgi:uncharacterized protein (TIGR00251 family)
MSVESTRLRLRVAPGAARSEVVGRHGDAWKVRVASPPVDGKANDAVLGLLAEVLVVPRRALTLVTGHGSRDKLVALDGLDADEAERRLAGAAR